MLDWLIDRICPQRNILKSCWDESFIMQRGARRRVLKWGKLEDLYFCFKDAEIKGPVEIGTCVPEDWYELWGRNSSTRFSINLLSNKKIAVSSGVITNNRIYSSKGLEETVIKLSNDYSIEISYADYECIIRSRKDDLKNIEAVIQYPQNSEGFDKQEAEKIIISLIDRKDLDLDLVKKKIVEQIAPHAKVITD